MSIDGLEYVEAISQMLGFRKVRASSMGRTSSTYYFSA